jgi:hypothetical protein
MTATATIRAFLHRRGAGAAALATAAVLTGCASETPPPAPATAPPAAGPATASAKALSVNTPVSAIAANPAGKAVLEQDLPGLLERPEYGVFKNMTLKSLAGMSNGKITPQKLDQVQHDLQAIPATDAPQP